MTFDEALRMADVIRQHYPRLDVLAVGRFIPPEEIDRVPERWGVSVRVDRGARPRVLWSHDELMPFSTDTRPKRQPKPRAAVEEAGVPLLF